jgi:quercetin dioxygenase-like cupin family protein
MRKFLAVIALATMVFLPSVLPAQTAAAKKAPTKPASPAVVIVTPDKIQWGAAPPIFQPGAQIAVLAGDPGKAGPFIIRLKIPDGYRIMPHWHPTAENVTVISGEFHAAMGDKFDESAMVTLPAGSVAVLPPHHNHYAMAKGETVVQVNAIGPFKLTYANPADDPTKGQTGEAPKKKAASKK